MLPAMAEAQNRPNRMGLPGQRGGPLGGRAGMRRDSLEAQVFNRFVDKISTDLRLDAGSRQRLTQHLEQTGQQRRQLAQQTVQMRRQLLNATRDSTVAEADVERLLTRFQQLRSQELELWSRENAALSQILTPRQRAAFMIEFMQFNERIRELVQQRPPGAAGRD
jgi:Spy/CpxP family protein refolding chaperone